jgi:IPT/TIG domain
MLVVREGSEVKRFVVLLAAVALVIPITAGTASAVAFDGKVAPKIYGQAADLNGSGTVTTVDDWNAFYGDTDIINGLLDCDAWDPGVANDGVEGNGVIGGDDDCTLEGGYDGTANGVDIDVINGEFLLADGVLIANGYQLPFTFNASQPDNPSVIAADFGWQVIGGKVDANGDGDITGDDCSVGIVEGMQILGQTCGLSPAPETAFNGMVDVNLDEAITSADDNDTSFFGLSIVDGLVQAVGSGPDITSISPTSGPVGTVLTITGTNLSGATVTVGGKTAVVTSNNGTTLVTSVPSGVAAGAVSVVVTTAGGSDSIGFTVTTAATPTITSFTPTSGPVGTSVKIAGTNFTGTTSVTFNNVAATFTVNSATQITATVPATATTGKIKVMTPNGTATSATNFTVGVVTKHSRSATLTLKKHLVARGTISAGAFTACAASVPVKIQRRVSGSWKGVASTITSGTGAYKAKLTDKPGRYRAKAKKVSLNDGLDVCLGAISPVRKHTH